MAHPEIQLVDSGIVIFTLSNKPDLLIMIDKDDYFNHVHNTKHWYVHFSSHQKKPRPYVRSHWVNGVGHNHLHREVLGLGKWSHKSVGDHINGDSLDCRRVNLRECTTKENVMGKRTPSIPYKGCAIAHVRSERYTNGYYQAYRGSTYIGSGTTLDAVKLKIDAKLNGGLQHEG